MKANFRMISLALLVCLSISTMAQKPSAKLLTPTNHILVLVDNESQMAFAVVSIPVYALRNNTAMVAGASKLFNVPTIVTTVAEKSFSGPVFPEVEEFYPKEKSGYIDRTTMNAWEDINTNWHYSYGGGIWVAPINTITFSAGVFIPKESREESPWVLFRLGYSF